jgi:hypothetical protein
MASDATQTSNSDYIASNRKWLYLSIYISKPGEMQTQLVTATSLGVVQNVLAKGTITKDEWYNAFVKPLTKAMNGNKISEQQKEELK